MAPAGGVLSLEERKARGVNIHGHRSRPRGERLAELLVKRLRVPRLNRHDACAAELRDEIAGLRHDAAIEAVAGPSKRASLLGGTKNALVIANRVVLLAIMPLDVTDRGDHNGKRKLTPKNRARGVGLEMLMESVHI